VDTKVGSKYKIMKFEIYNIDDEASIQDYWHWCHSGKFDLAT